MRLRSLALLAVNLPRMQLEFLSKEKFTISYIDVLSDILEQTLHSNIFTLKIRSG